MSITVLSRASMSDGTLKELLCEETYTETQTNAKWDGGVVSIDDTAAGTALAIANLTSAGQGWFKNAGSDGYVEIGTLVGGSMFVAFAKLLPEQEGRIPLATSSIYAKAESGKTVPLAFKVLDR